MMVTLFNVCKWFDHFLSIQLQTVIRLYLFHFETIKKFVLLTHSI